MNRAAFAMGIGAAAVSLAVVGERPAEACGGCFQPPTQTASDVTDERMLLSVSPLQTTLYDQIRYAGSPSSFAWVLPIHGTVDVGLSADVLFDSVDSLTQTTIQAPPLNCPVPAACQNQSFGAAAPGGGSSGSSSGGASGGVTVIKAENVGPYATVQLSTNGDAGALNAWLTQNGFDIPASVVPTLDAYVAEGFDFLAMKLLPDQGVQSMRPVRVTTTGASLSLPLRMAAIGTGATVGITIWVVADGRYEPQNFPFFHIDDSQLVWDWSTSSSNYTTLRQQDEQALGGKGWELESSITLNEQVVETLILNGGTYSGGYGGSSGSSGGATSDASQDYLPVTSPDGGTAETADQVRADDLTTLFAGMAGPAVRFTRIRSDIAHAAMTTDFVLQASSDQSEVSNVRQVTQSINEQCPIYGSDCSIVGTGSAAQAAASGPQVGGLGGIWNNGGGGSVTGGTGGGGPFSPGAMSSSGSNGTRGSGCSATARNSDELPIGLAAVAGLVGLASLRSRRRRG
jgi:MYXO-CTERM domain-containing protein